QPQQEYQYDLIGCGKNIKFIELDAADVLHYEVEDIESGDSCRLEVLDERRKDELETDWSSGRPGVIFWTKSLVVIDRDNRGQLRGVAMLSPGALSKDSF